MNLPLELNKRLLSEAQSSSTKPQAAPPNPSSPAAATDRQQPCHSPAGALQAPTPVAVVPTVWQRPLGKVTVKAHDPDG